MCQLIITNPNSKIIDDIIDVLERTLGFLIGLASDDGVNGLFWQASFLRMAFEFWMSFLGWGTGYGNICVPWDLLTYYTRGARRYDSVCSFNNGSNLFRVGGWILLLFTEWAPGPQLPIFTVCSYSWLC